jgi:integrase
MSKKNLPSPLATEIYKEAVLSTTKQGFYIEFWQTDPSDQQLKRHRKAFDLNKIHDKRVRKKRADTLILQINVLLADGYPYNVVVPGANIDAPKLPTILESLTFAKEQKSANVRKKTATTYGNICKRIEEYVTVHQLTALRTADFTAETAQNCMDWFLISKKLCNRSFNNYKIQAGVIFNLLKKKKHITINPFAEVASRREVDTIRRAFTPAERKAIMKEALETDYWLFLSILFLFCTLIRGEEMRRLRFSDIDIINGLIYLKPEHTKNWKEATVTIPNVMLAFLREERFTKYPENYLIFGQGGEPHANKCVGENTFAARFKKLTLRLQDAGILGDLTNTSPYCMKYSSNSEMAAELNPFLQARHNRHEDVKQSFKYFKTKSGESAIRKLKIELM